MSKSVHQEFDNDALKFWNLEAAPRYGVAANQGGRDIATIIMSDSEQTYILIKEQFSPSHCVYTTEKRAFLLPKSPISITRIRANLKEHGIVLTNDYTDCDLVITHSNFSTDLRDGNTIQTSRLMAKMWNYDALTYAKNNSKIGEYFDEHKYPVIYDDKFNFNLWNEEYDSVLEGYMFTGMCVNLAHRIKIESVSVMSVNDVIDQSATKQVLTQQLLDDISSQLNSGNEENIEMAGKLLPTIDYTKNYHLLWELAQRTQSRIYKLNRNKDVQHWCGKADLSGLYYRSAESMILWLEENELLDPTNFRYLEPIVRREIRIDNRNLYVFKVQVKPEYRKYIKNKSNGIQK